MQRAERLSTPWCVIGPQQVAVALDAVAESLSRVDRFFEGSTETSSHTGEAEYANWYLELAYVRLLVLAEALGLPRLRSDIRRDLARAQEAGFLTTQLNWNGEPELKFADPVRRYLASLQGAFSVEHGLTVTKNLDAILREAVYPLNDPAVFGSPPDSERAVHLRLEGILRCVFSDLRHKPRVSKPIKNFEPDTGIPSLHTLIEYKFLADPQQVGDVGDEILADTRGYVDPSWSHFYFVIYETRRIRSEALWREHLRECGVDERTRVIVLSGEAVDAGSRNSGRPRLGSKPLP